MDAIEPECLKVKACVPIEPARRDATLEERSSNQDVLSVTTGAICGGCPGYYGHYDGYYYGGYRRGDSYHGQEKPKE